MKLKLVVLAGAKEGLEIPLKKEKFLIGRAKECALRAGSEAISRRHCAITRHEDGTRCAIWAAATARTSTTNESPKKFRSWPAMSCALARSSFVSI